MAEVQRRLAEVGITDEDVAHRLPFQLSGGMCQRVALAAALARDPELLIADEPSTALDVTTQAEIMKLLEPRAGQRGMSLILITHDLRLAFSTCDRVYVLYAGSLMEVGGAQRRRATIRSIPTRSAFSSPSRRRRSGCRGSIAIRGSVPSADDVADRCSFADRCDWARDACRAPARRSRKSSRAASRPASAGARFARRCAPCAAARSRTARRGSRAVVRQDPSSSASPTSARSSTAATAGTCTP